MSTVTTTTQAFDAPLTIADRCDKCGAQAFVRAVFLSNELLFCGHHYAENADSLGRVALLIEDHRDRINAMSESSA